MTLDALPSMLQRTGTRHFSRGQTRKGDHAPLLVLLLFLLLFRGASSLCGAPNFKTSIHVITFAEHPE